MIIFMGVAGSGKSYQGRKLADKLGLPWLSTGEFLRMLVSGQRRKDMVSGKLLEDREIISLVQKIFQVVNINEEFVLDGFPRSAAQADWLLSQVKHGQLKVSAVIHLEASEKIVCERLLKRGRADDTKTAIKARFKEYETAVKPIIESFREMGVPVYDINAERSQDIIQKDILKALEAK